MSGSSAIVWFRQDLRLDDNPALDFAVGSGAPIVPVYIFAPEEESPWAPGGASCWWLHRSLHALDKSLRRQGSRLILRRGPALATLRALVRETGATTVTWNRRYEPAIRERDTRIKQALLDDGCEVRSFNGSLLFSPVSLRNRSDKPFQVFTPFWKHCLTLPVRDAIPPPDGRLPAPGKWPAGERVDDLGLQPVIPWDEGFHDCWEPGESGAATALLKFLEDALSGYPQDRNRPDLLGTSRLSPHLHFGEISPVAMHHAVRQRTRGSENGSKVFMSEVGWREFGYHLLYHFPQTTDQPLRPEFSRFPWQANDDALRAWQRGETGYPIVDAGMRQLWKTGWMHNRVRMIVASFLVKHLLQPWQAGAKWFWDTLVDADLASNTLGWQWSAGCGADAAPYFRVFNPILQGVKFDPEGAYVKRWVPEVAALPNKWIHAPWEAPADELGARGIRLGEHYPHPIVDHRMARKRALEAYDSIKG